jgi:hypothetical protein
MPSTAILMRVVFLIFLLMFWGQIAGAQTAASQTIFTIQVEENGTAYWTVEKYIPFETSSEINEWNNIMKGNDSNRSRIDILEFSDRINISMNSSVNYSNRSMRAENFNISYEVSKSLESDFGIIRYTFDWINFSHTESGQILIGDAFSDAILSSDNVLVIEMPEGYNFTNVTPKYDKIDGNKLTWDRTTSFKKGEPSLVLSKEVVAQETEFNIVYIIALIILFSGGIFILVMRKYYSGKKGNEKEVKNDASESRINEGRAEPITGRTENGEFQTEISGDFNTSQMREILSDEEMIEKYLAKFGGQAYQSEIVKESGLSKSKISIVLAKMKEEGRILKIRKGKENIIRLVPKNN